MDHSGVNCTTGYWATEKPGAPAWVPPIPDNFLPGLEGSRRAMQWHQLNCYGRLAPTPDLHRPVPPMGSVPTRSDASWGWLWAIGGVVVATLVVGITGVFNNVTPLIPIAVILGFGGICAFWMVLARKHPYLAAGLSAGMWAAGTRVQNKNNARRFYDDHARQERMNREAMRQGPPDYTGQAGFGR